MKKVFIIAVTGLLIMGLISVATAKEFKIPFNLLLEEMEQGKADLIDLMDYQLDKSYCEIGPLCETEYQEDYSAWYAASYSVGYMHRIHFRMRLAKKRASGQELVHENRETDTFSWCVHEGFEKMRGGIDKELGARRGGDKTPIMTNAEFKQYNLGKLNAFILMMNGCIDKAKELGEGK